jgi:predicted O-linked N-acetylglucosamine transferase (SPINDLY family)
MTDVLLDQARRAFESGDFAEAARLYGGVLAAAPRHFEALARLGLLQLHHGDFETAQRQLGAALTIDGQSADLFFHRGCALQNLRRHEEAIACFSRACAIKPDHIEALNNWGTTLLTLGRNAEALVCFDQVLALRSDLALVHNNRAATLLGLRRFEECAQAAEQALRLDPDNLRAMVNRGAADYELGRYQEAIEWAERVLARDAKQLSALQNLGNAHWALGCYQEAFAAYDRAYAIDPERPYLESWRMLAKLHICEWANFGAETVRLDRNLQERKKVEPFLLLLIGDSAEKQLACATRFVSDRYGAAVPVPPRKSARNADKLRIGYVSGEFRAQATSYLLADLVECHDRSAVEVYAFATGPSDGSTVRRRLEKGFDHFLDVAKSGDGEILEAVKRAGIDILVDLNGHFGVKRTQVFASRPCPIQVNYLGYPATMGAPFIDYIIADETIVPEGMQRHYSEKLVYLPHSYQANDRKRPIGARSFTRSECGLPDRGVVFVCFNSNHKLNPAMFDIWTRLLAKIPDSVLWLLEGNASVKRNLVREAAARGIEARRLVFAPFMQQSEHLARLKLADIFLDTLPCNAHTTASDALWAGVPVLTALGSTFAGRVAASLVKAAGVPELAVASLEDYERAALEFASKPELISAIKAKLAANKERSPLFDTPRFARHLEAAYKSMWNRYESGLPPAAIKVAESV